MASPDPKRKADEQHDSDVDSPSAKKMKSNESSPIGSQQSSFSSEPATATSSQTQQHTPIKAVAVSEEDDIGRLFLKHRITIDNDLVKRVKIMMHLKEPAAEDDELEEPSPPTFAINEIPDDASWGTGSNSEFLCHNDRRITTLTVGFVAKTYFYDEEAATKGGKTSATVRVWPAHKKLVDTNRLLLHRLGGPDGMRQPPQSSQKTIDDTYVVFSHNLFTFVDGHKTFVGFNKVYDGQEEVKETTVQNQIPVHTLKENDLVVVHGHIHRYTAKNDSVNIHHTLDNVFLVAKAKLASTTIKRKKGL